MKKHLISALALIFAAVMLFTACGGNDTPAPTEVPTEAPTEAPTASPTEAPTEEPVSDTLADRIHSYIEAFLPSLESIKDSVKDIFDIDCYAEDKSLVLEYRYLQDFAGTAEALMESLNDNARSFVEMFNELKEYTGSDEVSVILRYINSDGSHILDYVADSELAALLSAAAEEQQKFASLEELIESEAFREAWTSVESDHEVTASVENGDTLVITYRYLFDMTEEDLGFMGILMDQTFAEAGPGMISELKSTVLSSVGLEDVNVVFRFTDAEGNVFTTYPKN